jgi:ATP-dependent helicase YprA (DUF1998 family)
MDLSQLEGKLHHSFQEVLAREGINELRPSQEKSINAGLLDGKNIVVCTPTASGKTLIAEMAMLNSILEHGGKVVRIGHEADLGREDRRVLVRRRPGDRRSGFGAPGSHGPGIKADDRARGVVVGEICREAGP